MTLCAPVVGDGESEGAGLEATASDNAHTCSIPGGSVGPAYITSRYTYQGLFVASRHQQLRGGGNVEAPRQRGDLVADGTDSAPLGLNRRELMSRLIGGNWLASVLALAMVGFMVAAAFLGRISWVSAILLFIVFCLGQWRIATGRVPESPQIKAT